MEPIRKVDEIRINNPSAGDGGPHEIDPQLDGSAIGGNFEEHMTVEGKPLTDEQRDIITSVVAAIRNNEQVLLFLHSGGGTGKSTVIRALNKILDMHGSAQANSCPTGVGATFLDKGKTFHSLFRAFTVDLNASGIIDDIKRELGGDALKLVVVDEVSMLKSEYLLLLHKRLASMYDPNKPFGGISVILLGDFLQLPTVAGTPLYKTMYGNVKPGDAQVRALFQQFHVIEMQQQLRAGQCEIQQRRLLSFRALPSSYPKFGSRWGKADMEKFQPITEDVLDGVMTELKREEVEKDDHWTTSATCLTTTNLDRSVINNIVARIFGAKMGQAVVRWKRQFRKKFDVGVKEAMDNLLYLEDKYPELFGYFVYGAPAQILDNGNGNVSYGVANGTSCKMVALAWDDPSREKKMHDLTSSIASTDGVIDLEYPPDYIIVQVNIADATNWPAHLNLSSDEGTVYIPIGLKTNRGGEDKDSITLSNDQKIAYLAHAVDLSFAITTWKSQGGTFEIVVVLLESYNASSKQKLSFELLYVMFSRVKNAGGFRCLPLSAPLELRKKLRRLYPNIFATKYRMDINEDGFWDGSKSEEQSREQPKTKTHRNQPKAAIARQKHKEALKKNKLAVNTSHGTPKTRKPPIKSSRANIEQNKTPRLVTPSPENFLDMTTKEYNTKDLTQEPTTENQGRQMSRASGLPLHDVRFFGVSFGERGLKSLRASTWVTDEAVDLFSILELQDSENVIYVPSSLYTHYCSHLALGNTHPTLISERPIHEPEERRQAFRSKKMWIATICHNHHWQTLCIINPGKEQCVVILLDSLIHGVHARPTNFDRCRMFATALVNEVYGNDNLANRQALVLRICLVPQQPNYDDCGVFTVLNVRHAALRVNDFVSFASLPEWNVFLDWYTVEFAVGHRRSLWEQYDDMLTRYSN